MPEDHEEEEEALVVPTTSRSLVQADSAWRVLLVGCGIEFASGLSIGLVPPIAPFYVESLGAGQLWSGASMSAGEFATLFGTPVALWGLGRFGSRRVILVGILMQSVFCILYGLNDWIMKASGGSTHAILSLSLLWRCLSGLGVSLGQASSSSLTLKRFGANEDLDGWKFNSVASYQEASYGLAAMLAGPMASSLYLWGGYPVPFIAGGLLMLPLLHYSWGLHVHEAGAGSSSAASLGIRDVLTPRLALVALVLVANMATENAVIATAAIYAEHEVGMSKRTVGFMFMGAFLPYVVATPLFGKLADAIGAQRILALGTMASGLWLAVSLGLLGGAFAPGSAARIAYMVLAYMLTTSCWSCTYAVLLGALSEAARGSEEADDAIGTFTIMVWSFSGIVGPLLGTSVVRAASFEWLCLLLGTGLALLGLGLHCSLKPGGAEPASIACDSSSSSSEALGDDSISLE